MSGNAGANGGSGSAIPPHAAARPPLALDVLATDAGNNVGHEGVAFVAPSSYLRPRGQSRPSTPAANKPMMSALDREQLEGLVSIYGIFFPYWCGDLSTTQIASKSYLFPFHLSPTTLRRYS